jgi:hypothetical protein
VIVAFRPGPTLEVATGSSARHEGDTLYLMPAATALDGRVILSDPLISRSVLEMHANDAWDDGMSWSLGAGWMSVELRPVLPIDGSRASYLGLAVAQETGRLLTGRGLEVEPLPSDQQPDQADPMVLPERAGGEELPAPGQGPAFGLQLPAFQLLDRTSGQWVEFPMPSNAREMRIASPQRYLDATGALRMRFVNRVPNSGVYFSVSARIEADAA